MIVWSVISLIALLGGIGVLFAVFGRWRLGWQGRDQATLSFRSPSDVALTPAQRACAWFFFVMAALFLLQTLVGGMSQHYRAHLDGFFGIDVAHVFPYNLVRTWHVQLAIFFVSTSFVAAGIFLAPMIAGREPKGQRKLAFFLLGALAVVVFGSLFGEFADIHGWFSGIFGLQGFEYLDLGRFWQVLLIVGLCVWGFMLYRGLKGRLTKERVGNMPWLFFLAALAIPAFYAVGLLVNSGENFTITDYWRFWVVHLWVEDFLELFTTTMVAYIFVLLGVVRERVALTVVLLDVILYSVGGVIGTMHHLYFSGAPAENMALGAFFSALEVMPLTFLTVEAWSFLQLGARQESKSADALPAPLGGHVPGGRRLLELPGRRHLRLPDQPADRLLLRDRHGAHGQPRAHGDDGRLRHARRRARALLPALPDPGGPLEGARGEDELLGSQHRAGLDVVRDAVPARHPADLRVGEQRLLPGPLARLPDQQHQHCHRVAAAARRHLLHPGRGLPAALPHLSRRPPHREARDDR